MNNSTNLIVNRDAPPFDNPDLRQALALALDRKAFIDILNQGDADARRHHAAAPRRRVGPAAGDARRSVPGYGPTSRRTARRPARS